MGTVGRFRPFFFKNPLYHIYNYDAILKQPTFTTNNISYKVINKEIDCSNKYKLKNISSLSHISPHPLILLPSPPAPPPHSLPLQLRLHHQILARIAIIVIPCYQFLLRIDDCLLNSYKSFQYIFDYTCSNLKQTYFAKGLPETCFHVYLKYSFVVWLLKMR